MAGNISCISCAATVMLSNLRSIKSTSPFFGCVLYCERPPHCVQKSQRKIKNGFILRKYFQQILFGKVVPFLTLQRRDFHNACAHVRWLTELHSQLPCTVRRLVVPHSLGPKGKWSGPFSAHSYSFHPTVLREKAWSSAQRPAVSGSGVRADLLRGRGAPIQSVIKHTAHPADPDSSARSCGLASASPGCLRSNTSRRYLWPCVISLDVS